MRRQQQALRLIERIYEAAVEPSAWQDFVAELAEALDDVSIGFGLQLPGFPLASVLYVSGGFLPGFEIRFAEHLARGLPWEAARTDNFVGRFGLGNEVFPDAQLEHTDFYRDWMKPQGLAPVCPMGHTVLVEAGRALASVAVFRREGGGPFTAEELAIADPLVPHLARAYQIHRRVRENAALAEAVDRLPTGVMLLDARHAPVVANRAAKRIFALKDGLSIDKNGPHAERPGDNAVLQKIIADAIESPAANRISEGNVMAVTRSSGARAFPLMVASLLKAPPESTLGDALAVLYVSDLEGNLEHSEVLRVLYSLTDAETQLVELLCDGCSLDEAAERRGVTMNTARSQLKQVFAKTNTSRQSELVRLVLAGIAPIRKP